MKILVLGAGVVGTTSAWYLAQAGHRVTVIDRQPVAGNETSFANGGQISVSHAEPWANPHVLPQVLRWLGREDAPLLWRWRADAAQWSWGLRFLRECLPGRTRANIAAIVALALYSRQQLGLLRAAQGLEYDQLTRGILHLYTEPKAFAQAQAAAALMRQFGLNRHTVDVARCLEIEPALHAAQVPLLGGDFTPEDESGDAHRFTRTLAEKARQAGVDFRFSCTVDRLNRHKNTLVSVDYRTAGGETDSERADAVVMALGSYSPLLLKPLGIHLPVYPAKGYSATLTLADANSAPTVSLTDDERRIVFSRLGNRLRIAGTAEFNGYNLDLNPVRCQALIERGRSLFPNLKTEGEPLFWCGLRPATPSNVPFIGRVPAFSNLWLNTGHGTLGWTLSCGSAALLSDLVSERSPAVNFPVFGR